MSADLNNAVHRLRQDRYPNDQDGRAARQADIEQLSHALGLAENTIDHLVGDLAKEVNGQTFMGEPAFPHPDDAAVDSFADALKEKLARARRAGRSGWNSAEPGMQQRLSDMLRAHVEKGDPRDVANFCMFLQQRDEIILPTRPQNQVEVLPGRYFAADPAMGDFDLYATLADARTNAQRMLDEATDEAADGGWPDAPPQICYGIVLSECLETDRKPAPVGSEFDEIVTFELAPTAQPGLARHPRPSMQFTLGQAETLLAFFGGSNGDMTVEHFPANHWPDSPEAPAGLYVYCTEYPEEGAQWLGREDNSEEIEPTWQHRLLKKAENGKLFSGGNPSESFRENYKAMVAAAALSDSRATTRHLRPTMQAIITEVLAEVGRATTKFPTWPSDPLHAVVVLGEEFGELTKAVMQATYEPHKNGPGDVRDEAVQTAAMALRFLASLDRYEYAGSAQHHQEVV